MGFRVEMIGDFTFKEEIDGIILDWKKFKKEFIRTGRTVHKFMIDYIKTTSKGTSNASVKKLHKEIDFKALDEGFRVVVEIGDVAKLNTNAPWWAIINFGGAHPMAGKFIPGEWHGRKNFMYFPGSDTGMTIKANARIKPINYVENTEHFGTAAYQRLIQLSTTR